MPLPAFALLWCVLVRPSSLLVFAVLLSAGACTSASEPASFPAGPDASSTDAADAERRPVWTASSTRIRLTSFGYWQGSSGYDKERKDLSSDQLALLDGLRTLAIATGPRTADGTSFRVEIFDIDGTSTSYRAARRNVVDSDEGSAARLRETIDYATLDPLLATFRCLSAKDAGPRHDRITAEPASPTVSSLATAAALPTDVGCLNGVFFSSTCHDSFFTLDVSEPATYVLRNDGCFERTTARLLSSDGETVLAESTPAAGDGCFVLQHDYVTGRYVVELSKTNLAGCADETKGSAGDTVLRLRKAN